MEQKNERCYRRFSSFCESSILVMGVGHVCRFTWNCLLIGGHKYLHAFSSLQENLVDVILTPPALNGHIFLICQPFVAI